MKQDATPVAAKTSVAQLQTCTHTNSTCKQGGKNQEWQKEQIEPHTGPTHPHTAEAKTYHGNQSAPNPDRRTQQTRLNRQMISQLCCLLREKKHPLQYSADDCCCFCVFPGPRLHGERPWLDVVNSRGPAFLLCCQ